MSNVKVEILTQKGHKFLWIDDYLWMWDVPPEQKTQKEIADKCHGNVLVVGYGLGVVQGYLKINSNVESVFTLESHIDVIKACARAYGRIHGAVAIGNFYDYVPTRLFDCVVGDIWEDIMPESLEEYKKFKAKAEKCINEEGLVLAWGWEYFEYLIEKGK